MKNSTFKTINIGDYVTIIKPKTTEEKKNYKGSIFVVAKEYPDIDCWGVIYLQVYKENGRNHDWWQLKFNPSRLQVLNKRLVESLYG